MVVRQKKPRLTVGDLCSSQQAGWTKAKPHEAEDQARYGWLQPNHLVGMNKYVAMNKRFGVQLFINILLSACSVYIRFQ